MHVRLQFLLDDRDAGRNFHRYPIERVSRISPTRGTRRPQNLSRRRQHHARRPALRGLCEAIVERASRHRLHRAGHDVGDRRPRRPAAPLMQRAGFRYVFLGIETSWGRLIFCAPAPRQDSSARGRHGPGSPTRSAATGPSAATPDQSHRAAPSHRCRRGWLIVGNPTTRANQSKRTWHLPAAMSTGRTSSIRRPIRERR